MIDNMTLALREQQTHLKSTTSHKGQIRIFWKSEKGVGVGFEEERREEMMRNEERGRDRSKEW